MYLEEKDFVMAKMGAFFRNRPAKLRPHFKNHKCVALARRQIAAGAIGMTCAKLGEAEVLGEHGFHDLLIANQVVGPEKMKRLTRLAGIVDKVAVAIDHIDESSLRIEDRFIKIDLFKYKVWKAVIDKFRVATAAFRATPAVIVPKLPIPSQVAGIPIRLKDFQSDGNGYMVLYLEYANTSGRR
jgi:hypothetical protein